MTTERIKAALASLLATAPTGDAYRSIQALEKGDDLDKSRREAADALAAAPHPLDMDVHDVALERIADELADARTKLQAAVRSLSDAWEALDDVKDALDDARRARGLIK